jgi:pyocin large subunit-like protein
MEAVRRGRLGSSSWQQWLLLPNVSQSTASGDAGLETSAPASAAFVGCDKHNAQDYLVHLSVMMEMNCHSSDANTKDAACGLFAVCLL